MITLSYLSVQTPTYLSLRYLEINNNSFFKQQIYISFKLQNHNITNMRIHLLLLLLIMTLCAQYQLKYLTGKHDKQSVQDLVNKFTQLQDQIYKKLFQHYMLEQIPRLRSKGATQNQVKERLLQLLTDPKGPLLSELTQYMQDRLFKKLEMGILTASLRNEIKKNPGNFYLTFYIYDILFD